MAINLPTRINIVFGIFIAFIYCIVGILFIFFSESFFQNVDANNKKILGAIILIYGIYRSVRLYRKYPRNEENNNE